MDANELNKINDFIKETKKEVEMKIEWMKMGYLHSLEIQRKILFETFTYERSKIKLGCVVSYGGRQYYVTDLNFDYFAGWDSLRKKYEKEHGVKIFARLNEKCDKNYEDKRKWYIGEDKIKKVYVKHLIVIKEDEEARKLVLAGRR